MSEHTRESIHGQIINIQGTSAEIGAAVETALAYDNDWESRLAFAYKLGHRDARDSAAKIALKSSAEIKKLKGQRDRAVEALKDFAEFGCRHDCNPTTRFGMKEMDRLQWAIDRFKSMDNYVIEKARAAIAEIDGGE